MPPRGFVPCNSVAKPKRSRLAQGLPAVIATLLSSLAQACGSHAPVLERWPGTAADRWWVRAERGDADERNRGRVSNLLLVREGERLWLVGSGPSPTFGRRLDCVVRRDLGRPVTDVISPWPRPELVLGAAGLPRARHWAHVDVAQAMRTQCARCLERLRRRLGAAATDLGPSARAVRRPERTFDGDSGQLGPFAWQRAWRAPGVPVTLWRERSPDGSVTAHGLLWSGDAPDLRDAALAPVRSATQQLASFAQGAGAVLGEQGPPVGPDEIRAHLAYWNALERAVLEAQASGRDENDVPRSLPGIEAARIAGAAHALNWQRAWRQTEEAAFDGTGRAWNRTRPIRR